MNVLWGSALVKVCVILIPTICSLFASKGLFHYFQLESYQFPGYFHT